jgi:hypothetical protein
MSATAAPPAAVHASRADPNVVLTLVPADASVEAIALSSARCPGAPNCGHLALVAAFGRRVREAGHLGAARRHA